MRHLIVAAIASVGVAGFLATGPAWAQAQRPFPQSGNPALSGYLNLLRGGNPAVNYYGLVRPQQLYNTAINSLEQQVAASRVAARAAESLALPSTGHPIYFLNYRSYFLNVGAQAPFQNLQATVGAGAASGASAGQRATSNIISGATTPSFRRF